MNLHIDKVKKLICATTCAAVLSSTLSAAAAEPVTPDTFDYEQYADRYPDLKQNLGYDKNLLWYYYETYGKEEGRIPGVTPAAYLNLQNFDAAAYGVANPDVAAALGNDPQVLLNHYLTVGCKEGRIAHGLNDVTDAKCQAYLLAHQITNDSMTDMEKIKAVHDWIITSTSYDYDNYKAGTVPYKSLTMAGVIQDGVAVCDGYCKAFQFFMDVLGIECEIQTGQNHAWNRVKTGGQWYLVDCTWDDPIYYYNGVRQEVLLYRYFMVPEP